jgi:non-specific serine/threonine protein kinase
MGTTVRVYDPATGHWRKGPPLPAAESFGTLVSDGQRLYVMGGLSSDGQGLRTVYRLDSPDGSWSQDSPLPQGRFSGAAAWDGHRVVFAGGSANIHQPRPAASDVWALTSGHWVRIATLPTPREHLAAATDGSGTVWFVGGANVSVGPTGVYAEVDVLRGSHVTRAGSLPKPVQGLSAAWSSATGICAFGGSTTLPNDNPAAVRTVTCLGDRKLPELPRETGLPVSATLGGTVYVVAGPEMFLLPVGA